MNVDKCLFASSDSCVWHRAVQQDCAFFADYTSGSPTAIQTGNLAALIDNPTCGTLGTAAPSATPGCRTTAPHAVR
ncbi:hypothetical protein ACFYUD_11580 [Nocardia tengchongensis]|uniref:hypothetical protein n=1 Tax=Nocardia tengchongensis TaxID=2055889 RepID=UPI0036A1CD73